MVLTLASRRKSASPGATAICQRQTRWKTRRGAVRLEVSESIMKDMAETNGNITKQDLRNALTESGQHILHEVNMRFDETNARLESIDSRLKLQAGLIQSGARAMARFSEVKRIEALEKWKEETGL